METTRSILRWKKGGVGTQGQALLGVLPVKAMDSPQYHLPPTEGYCSSFTHAWAMPDPEPSGYPVGSDKCKYFDLPITVTQRE